MGKLGLPRRVKVPRWVPRKSRKGVWKGPGVLEFIVDPPLFKKNKGVFVLQEQNKGLQLLFQQVRDRSYSRSVNWPVSLFVSYVI